jgi:hypothetical protein
MGGFNLEVQHIENSVCGFFSFTPGFSQVTILLHQAEKPFKTVFGFSPTAPPG